MENAKNKILFLDGLRGLAALNVVLSHFICGFYPALWTSNIMETHTVQQLEIVISRSPLNIFYNGNLAVCIFFVISAYVLSCKFFAIKDSQIITKSACRRYVRLVIPILFSTILIWCAMKIGIFYNQQAAPITASSWWLPVFWTFEPNFLIALKQSFWDCFFNWKQEGNYNLVLWTMQYEMKGSFLVFSFLALFGHLYIRRYLYFVAMFIFLDSYYLAFILGLFLSDLYNSEEYKPLVNKLENTFLLNSIVIILGIVTGTYFDDNKTWLFTQMNLSFFQLFGINTFVFYHIVGASLITFVVLNSRKMQSLLSGKMCLFLGKISFSMYLIHILIICTLSSYLFVLFYNKGISYKLSFLFTFIPSILVIFGLSWLMTKYFDEPAIKFSKIIQKLLLKS